jgi:hypothetical protein
MPYTINLSSGQPLFGPSGLSDGTVDSSHTSIYLIGKNYANYGTFLNDNLVHMLENFSSQSAPANPLVGQLWWNPKYNILQIYTGSNAVGPTGDPGWKITTGATSLPHNTPPSDYSKLGGDLWFDKDYSQLKVSDGLGNWITVGPVATPATGNTGAVPTLMADTAGANHIVIQFIISGVVYAIIAKEPFSSILPGFATVRAGLNFSTIASPLWGLSTQDVNPTVNTLVQRDGTGGISAVTANATTVIATTVNATNLNGIFTGNLYGNVTATSVSATGSITAPAMVAGSYQGTLVTAVQPNITTVGIIANLITSGTTSLTGKAYYNGFEVATIGGSTSFSSINNTPIGNSTPSTGAFTTLSSTGTTTHGGDVTITGNLSASNYVITPTVLARQVGNTGTTFTGTVSTANQPNIQTAANLTTVGTIGTGVWQGTTVSPTYGGTGANNGSNIITATTNVTLNQSVASGSAPTFVGTNFSNIPNGALTNNSITINAGTGLSGGGTVALGGTVSIAFAGSPVVGINGTANQVIVTGAGNAPTLSTPQNLHTGANFQVNSLGVGTGASATQGEIRATNNIVAYYSDDRLKTRLGKIENALDKLCSLEGFYYEANETAQSLGYTTQREMGVSAQKTNEVAPEIVKPAPIDDKYLTVQYERFAPLIIEAIKELRAEVNDLKQKLS